MLCAPPDCLSLQKGSSQVFSHSLYERDLEIGRLRKESEKLKRDHALASGIVSLELCGGEQKIQQLKEDVEKMKKENRLKDNQLAVVSAKVNIPSDGLSNLQSHVRVNAEKGLAPLSWMESVGCNRENPRSLMWLPVYSKSQSLLTETIYGPSTGKVIEKVSQLSDENQQSHEREKCLQEELSSRISKEKEVSANVEVFKKSLQDLQACLRSSCSSESLRGELGRLEAVCLDPSVSAIGMVVVEMVHVPLSWLEGAEQLLASVGMEMHSSSKGLCPAGCPWEQTCSR
uniref:Uncharacterized protein n=1 Tax=Otus sunia TaxID=257818 RepID=A0A8C8B563_9STRI